MDFTKVAGLVVFLMAAGAGVQKVVDLLKSIFDQAGKFPKAVWIAASFAVPALGVYLGDVSASDLGLGKLPNVVGQVVVITTVGAFAAFAYRGERIIRAKQEIAERDAA